MMKTDEILEHFDIRQAAALCGLKQPMLDYLCRQGILVPSLPKHRGRGRKRRYTFGDVVMLRVLAKLLGRGISVKRIRDALIALRKHHAAITPTSLPERYLITDGEAVFLWRSKTTLETLDEAGQMTFAFVIELATVRDEVITQVEKTISRRARR